MSDKEEMITITKKEYNELMEDSVLLSFLNAAGVDNWDGYEYAIDMMEENCE